MNDLNDLYPNHEVVFVSYKRNDNMINSNSIHSSRSTMQSPLKGSAMVTMKGDTSSHSNPFLSFNFCFLTTIVMYVTMVFLPKSLKKGFMNTLSIYRSRLSTGIGSSNNNSSNDLSLDENNNVINQSSYQNDKQQYHDLIRDGGKSLANDDEESARTNNAVINPGTTTCFKKRDVITHYSQKKNNEECSNTSKVKDEGNGVGEVVSPQSRLLQSRRRNYGSSLPLLDTKFVSTCTVGKANLTDNEDLSPLDSFQKDDSFDSIFRQRTNTKSNQTKKKNKVLSQKTIRFTDENQVPMQGPSQPQSTKSQNVPPSKTPTSAVSWSDVFSINTNMFSPPANIMDVFLSNKEGGESNHKKSDNKTANQDNNNILVEKQMNSINNSIDNFSNVQGNFSDVTITPRSFHTHDTTNYQLNVNMDYTPSPLSDFSKQIGFSQAIVILISSDIIFQQQHAQQQNALMILLSKKFHLPVKVVDANDEKQAMRREELFRISGLRGQYPQIFLVDSQKRLTYLGHHISLDKLLSENVGDQMLFSPSLMNDAMQNKNANNMVDESFFSI